MIRKTKLKRLTLILLITSTFVFSQEENQDDDIDTSKPTNFYNMLDNTIEFANQPNQNVFGYRGKLTFALSEAHLVLAEIPLLYNDRTSKFGLGDIRARYFWLPYKNYEKVFGAFGPSVDIFVPTGSHKNGLGSGRLIVSPGLTVGLMVADWIQLFPILSYQYAGKPVYDNPPVALDKAIHGLSFQVLMPIVFSDKFFMQVTPIYKMNDFTNEKQDRVEAELFGAYSLNDKMQITGFYGGKFEDKIHTVSVGLTIFL